MCQRHKESQEQRLKKRFKFNFQTKNTTILCDLKTRKKQLRTRTRDMQKKCENEYLLC
jgi:hypothetical protein